MSKYTTEVRFICENAAGYTDSKGYANIESIIKDSKDKIFDFDFPIFDEDYRSVIETKILRHYYTREIGMETVGLWKHFLNMRMNEIMPYYNKLYESELIAFNPLFDVDYKIEHSGSDQSNSNSVGVTERNTTYNETQNAERTSENSNSSNNLSSSDSMDKFADTPQGGLDNLRKDKYLTNARQVENITNADINSNGNESENIENSRTGNNVENTNDNRINEINNTDEYINHIVGKQNGVSYSKLLKEFRETFLNIDMLIINNLNDLFMGVW